MPVFFIRKKDSFPQDSTSPRCPRALCGQECSQHTSPGASVLGLCFVYRMAAFLNTHTRTEWQIKAIFSADGKETVTARLGSLVGAAHPVCVPSASAHPAQLTCRCAGAGVGRGLKEPLQEGPCRVTRRPGHTRWWAPGAARLGWQEGEEALAPGTSAPHGLSQPRAQLSGQLPGALDVCVCRGGRLSSGQGAQRGPGPTGLS